MAIYFNLFLEGAGKGNGDYKNWFETETVSSPIDCSYYDGSLKITFGNLVLVRKMDQYSTMLWESCATAKKYSKIVVEFTKHFEEGKIEQVYLRKTISDAFVSSYSFYGNSSGDPIPTEEIYILFNEEIQEYNVLDEKGNITKTVKGQGYNG